MSSKSFAVIILLAVLGILASDAFFTVHQTQQALVLQFGQLKAIHREPGLKMKIPFIQDVNYLERRVIEIVPPIPEVLLSDQKRINVSAYARYRIEDPLAFYRAVRVESRAQERLTGLIDASLRQILGSITLASLLSEERKDIMNNIKKDLQENAKELGINIIDVRIVRADLPQQTSESIYRSMRSERQREAADFRAQGQELAQQIKSRAERERTVILTEAQRDAQKVRGEGDAEAITTYASAFQLDPQFYSFYRSLEAYKKSLGEGDATIVLSPDSEFMKFFNRKG